MAQLLPRARKAFAETGRVRVGMLSADFKDKVTVSEGCCVPDELLHAGYGAATVQYDSIHRAFYPTVGARVRVSLLSNCK